MARGTYGLEVLLDLGVKGAGLEGNDLGGGVGVVGDGGAAVGAEEAPDGLAGGALVLVLLDGPVDGELVLGDDGDERVGAAGLALAVVAVVVAREEGLVDVGRVGDGLAEAVSGERHCGSGGRRMVGLVGYRYYSWDLLVGESSCFLVALSRLAEGSWRG